jgi:hypothetical protein
MKIEWMVKWARCSNPSRIRRKARQDGEFGDPAQPAEGYSGAALIDATRNRHAAISADAQMQTIAR